MQVGIRNRRVQPLSAVINRFFIPGGAGHDKAGVSARVYPLSCGTRHRRLIGGELGGVLDRAVMVQLAIAALMQDEQAPKLRRGQSRV